MKTIRTTLMAICLLAAALLLAACGGDDTGGDADSDPRELLDQAFGGETSIDSGVLGLALDASASGQDGGSVQATLEGPFQNRAEDELPLVDMDVTLKADTAGDDTDFTGGLTITEDGAFISADGTDYEVDAATFGTISELFRQSAQAQEEQGGEDSQLFDQLGVSPAEWLTDVTNEGGEELAGTEVVHISGTADVAEIVADAQSLSEQAGGAAGGALPEDIAGQLEEAVQAASVDVFVGADDGILRGLDLGLSLTEPGAADGDTIELGVSVLISGINEPQQFEAPANPKPLDELVPDGIGGLGALGGGEGAAAPDASGGGGGDLPGTPSEYLDCLEQAQGQGPEAINACAELL